jgi:hypothetical protein
MTTQEIITGLETFAAWNKGDGGPQLSRETLGEVIAAAISALTLHPFAQEPAKEHLPEPEPAPETSPAKAKKK